MASTDPADLFKFGLQQLQGFADRMFAAVTHYKSTGTLPDSIFKDISAPAGIQNGAAKPVKQTAKQRKAAKAAAAEADGTVPKKRGLTAFNWFVKAAIAELKASGTVPAKDEDGKPPNFMTLASAKWKDLGTQGQLDYTNHFKKLQEKGEIPEAGHYTEANKEASKKRKADEADAAAAEVVAAAAAEVTSPATKGAASTEKSKKKDAAAVPEAAQAATSPAGPSIQEAAPEELPKKKKKKKHHSTADAGATPDQVGGEVKNEEKKKKKHKKKHRDSTATATT